MVNYVNRQLYTQKTDTDIAHGAREIKLLPMDLGRGRIGFFFCLFQSFFHFFTRALEQAPFLNEKEESERKR